jgi:hypothetical protein
MKLTKETAKRLYPDAPQWFRDELEKEFGADTLQKRKWDDIRTFEDACDALGILVPPDLTGEPPDEIAYKKLKIVVKAINEGWKPDWTNTNQRKWFPWFDLSSRFSFSGALCASEFGHAIVGSHLCFKSEEKAEYAGRQFVDLYKSFLNIMKSENEKSVKKSEPFDYRSIKKFKHACKETGNPFPLNSAEGTPDEIAYKKLKIVIKAINGGWVADWTDSDQIKWFPWFSSSSGFSFLNALSTSVAAHALVGSHLCLESKEKAKYAGMQFFDLYKRFLT